MNSGDMRARDIDANNDQIGAEISLISEEQSVHIARGQRTNSPEEMLLDLSHGCGHANLPILI
jgi:hypothetical protein